MTHLSSKVSNGQTPDWFVEFGFTYDTTSIFRKVRENERSCEWEEVISLVATSPAEIVAKCKNLHIGTIATDCADAPVKEIQDCGIGIVILPSFRQ